MRSVRLRRGVAIFCFVVFFALLLTNLYAPDAGTEASQFDFTHEDRQNVFPLPAAILGDTNQQPEKNRQDGRKWQDDKTWQHGRNWQDWKNWEGRKNWQYDNNPQEVRTTERTGTKIASRHRNVTFEHHKHNKETARDNSPDHPQDHRNNGTLTKLHPDYQPGHRKWGSSDSPILGTRYHPDNRNVKAWKSGTASRERGAEFGIKDFQKSLAPDNRKDYRNRGTPYSPKFGPDYQPSYLSLGGDGADYRYIARPRGHPRLWPEDSNSTDDRILTQLNYIPRTYLLNATDSKRRTRTKKIYVPGGLGDVPSGRRKFFEDGCSVNACALTTDSRFRSTADLVLLQLDAFFEAPPSKPRDQIWVMWLLESPINTALFRNLENVINWTATYRSDSTIVTPYEKFVHNPEGRQVRTVVAYV